MRWFTTSPIRLTAAGWVGLGLVTSACTDDLAGPAAWVASPSSSVAGNLAAGPGKVSGGLRLWLRADAGVPAQDGGGVLQWLDQSGHGNHATFNAANSFGELPPAFVASNTALRGQPSVRFTGRNALEADLTWLAGSDYTIVVANGRDRFGLANFYIAGDMVADNRNLVLGYERPNLLRQAHFNNDLDAVVENYTGTAVYSLDTFRFEQAKGRDLYHNGALVATDASTLPLLSNTGSTLGHFRALPVFWFVGDLAEVAVYDRALATEDRLRVEASMAGRYGRPLGVEDYVPCEGPWQNHGQYVSAHARAVAILVAAGVMTPAAGGLAKARAARSACGR
jgi:hypothetical protein